MRKKNSVDIQRIRLHLQLTAITYDTNRGISLIDYDLLGNPVRVQFKNGSVTEYIYSADGTRQKTTHKTPVAGLSVGIGNSRTLTGKEPQSTTTIHYFGNFVYDNGYLKYYFVDGYTDGTTDGYHYYIRGHQGNNRIVANYQGTIEQTTHYYLFRGILSQSTNQGMQKFKYNGKEFDTMHGLNIYDYGARQQDPATGMFTSMDPLCEKYYDISPYMYCAGNPIRYVDPDGREIWITDGGEKYKYEPGSTYSGDNDFIAKTYSALNDLNNNGGNDLLVEMCSNDKIVNILAGEKCEYKASEPGRTGVVLQAQLDGNQIPEGCADRIGSGGTIFMNYQQKIDIPIRTNEREKERPFYIVLGHELKHGDNAMKGISNNKLWDSHTGDFELRQATYDEFSAMSYENMLREKAGLPLRTSYSFYSNNGPFMPIENK